MDAMNVKSFCKNPKILKETSHRCKISSTQQMNGQEIHQSHLTATDDTNLYDVHGLNTVIMRYNGVRAVVLTANNDIRLIAPSFRDSLQHVFSTHLL